MTWAVKVKRPGAKVWKFLGSDGRTTRLRIHAIEFTKHEDAANTATRIPFDNIGVEARVVEFRS